LYKIYEFLSYIPSWMFAFAGPVGGIIAGLITAMGIIGGLLQIAGGNVAKGIGTLIGVGLSRIFGKAGHAIAHKLAHNVTPKLLNWLGLKTWNYFIVGLRSATGVLVSLVRFPAKKVFVINAIIEDGTHVFAEFLGHTFGAAKGDALEEDGVPNFG
jgi:hypothetical protein